MCGNVCESDGSYKFPITVVNMMYERLLDKDSEPTPEQIRAYIGNESYECLLAFEEYMREHYNLSRSLRFPFGNNYGWGYKYGHGSLHLCYVFFERGAFTVTLQIGDKQAQSAEDLIGTLSPKARELWAGRYPCGDRGGWVHFRVLDIGELNDVHRLIGIRKKPA